MKHTEAIGDHCHRIYFCTEQIQKQVDAFYIEAKERLRDVPMHLLDPKKELFKRWMEREVNRFLIDVINRFGDLQEYLDNQLMSEPTKGE